MQPEPQMPLEQVELAGQEEEPLVAVPQRAMQPPRRQSLQRLARVLARLRTLVLEVVAVERVQ
jgi:hypothetical protein